MRATLRSGNKIEIRKGDGRSTCPQATYFWEIWFNAVSPRALRRYKMRGGGQLGAGTPPFPGMMTLFRAWKRASDRSIFEGRRTCDALRRAHDLRLRAGLWYLLLSCYAYLL